MPICGRCVEGFEPGDKCPKCGCPAGTWRPRLRGALLPPVVTVGVLAFLHLILSAFMVGLTLGVAWSSGPSEYFGLAAMLAAVLLLAPLVLAGRFFDFSEMGAILPMTANSVLWVLAAMGMVRIVGALRVRLRRRRATA